MATSEFVGNTVGRLLVLEECGPDQYSSATFRCVCECGDEGVICATVLRKGVLPDCSCDCEYYECLADFPAKPLRQRTFREVLRDTLGGMIQRCTNPRSVGFADYGGRGIAVHPDWMDKERGAERFHDFVLTHLGERPEGYSIDRIDCDGNYEPGNVRWASRRTQLRNQRRAVRVWNPTRSEYEWLPDYCRREGLNYDLAHGHVRLGKISDVIYASDCAAAKAARLRREQIMLAEGYDIETDEMEAERGVNSVYPQERPALYWRTTQRWKAETAYDEVHGEGAWYLKQLQDYAATKAASH